jgi:hypothetical protein
MGLVEGISLAARVRERPQPGSAWKALCVLMSREAFRVT